MSIPPLQNPVSDPSLLLSVIVPVYNEEAVLPAFHRRLTATLKGIHGRCEVIYVDDGSSDQSLALLHELRRVDPSVGVVRLSRNFGKEQAVSAGLRLAAGEAVVILDADLQDPPELIPVMLEAMRSGADVVNMRRRRRDGESWLKKTSARWFYRLLHRMSEVPIPEEVGDFRLLSRRAVAAVNLLPERTRFMKGLFAWIGFEQTTIDYDREPRAGGDSKWDYWRLWNFALEGITSFSTAPLKMASFAGLLSASGAFAYGLFFLLKTLFFGDPVQGFPTLVVSILFLGGLQLLAIGVLGEYVGRLFLESKRRPLYLIDDLRTLLPAVRQEARHPRATEFR
ncbi:MAG TPA: glycosyltransferase family 2 protein [Methylococcus sp.]|nr:glycosyltransferase family 2 protein [Methylococcus sp.]